MYLGVIEAILSRLQGNPRSFVPFLPEHPTRQLSGNIAGMNTDIRAKGTVNLVSRNIPIFFIDPSGRDMSDLWPSFTYDVLAITPRFAAGENNYQSDVYKGDYASTDVSFSQGRAWSANDDDGVTKGPMLVKTAPQAHPMDIMIEVQALSDDDVLSALMVDYIYRQVFQPRDFIRVPVRDGSFRSWDMTFKNYQDLDARRTVRAGSPGVERQYAKVWTYVIEGYLDTSDLVQMQATVRQRRFGLTKTTGG